MSEVSEQHGSVVSSAPGEGRFHVLALSGGGYRGLFTARILAEIEAHIGAPIATRFDLIAGTSIGGILALALALEIPAQTMVELFERHGDDIFKARFSLKGVLRSQYTQEGLERLLRTDAIFGNKVLGECRHRVIVPAINYTTGQPVMFKTPHHANFQRDHRHQVVDVALATSAAPGYFPRHVFNDCQYVDGGLFANAPGLLAVHEAQHFLGQPRKNLHVVAIGTMSSKFTVDPRRNRAGGTFDWGGISPMQTPKRLFGLAISAQETLVHHLLSHRLKAGQYFHLDDDLTDERARAVALDVTDRAATEVLNGAGRERAKIALGDPAFRALLSYQAPAPKFFYGANAVGGTTSC